jgi:hypothetical protein
MPETDSGMQTPAPKLCWICNGPADSGEHKTKKSDLKAAFGKPTQDQPFYYHDNSGKNRPVKSLDAKFLKSPDRICQECNDARTQPHDFAWQTLSEFFAANPMCSLTTISVAIAFSPIHSGANASCPSVFRQNLRLLNFRRQSSD